MAHGPCSTRLANVRGKNILKSILITERKKIQLDPLSWREDFEVSTAVSKPLRTQTVLKMISDVRPPTAEWKRSAELDFNGEAVQDDDAQPVLLRGANEHLLFIKLLSLTTDRTSIHMDLVIEILSRMPVKGLLKFKCLSKEFSRIIHSRSFVDKCLSCSSNRSRLLFYNVCYKEKKLVFFSAPHQSTCPIAPTRHDMTFGGVAGVSLSSPPVRGLILCTFGPNQHVICNPATRQNLSLPRNRMLRTRGLIEMLIFGYNPITDQFKVLCISKYRYVYPNPNQFWVLTAGQEEWRQIQGLPPHLDPYTFSWKHMSGGNGMCINGIIYFKAYSRTPSLNHPEFTTHVVSFDLNSEEFSLCKTNHHLTWFSKLIDFQGKLAFISRAKDCTIEFCLMENNEWSSRVFHLPWVQIYSSHHDRIISSFVLGTCDGGEVVFLPPDDFGFTWHLSLEKKTIRKVCFETPSKLRRSLVFFFVNHVDTTVSL